MQGQRSSVGSLPELSFHHVSASESGIDPQRCWNDARNPALAQSSDCVISSSNAGMAYLNSARHEGQNLSGWSLGESSSTATQGHVNQNDRMNVCTGGVCVLGGRQHGSSDILSLNVDANLITEQAANGCLFMQDSDSPSIPQDHNTNSDFAERNNDDDCQVIGCVSAFRSGSPNELLTGTSSSSGPFVTPSGSGGFLVEGNDGRPSSSLDARRLSCKRKTLEGSAGQSSGSGSSNYFQDSSASFWHAAVAHNITPGSIPAPLGSNLTVNLAEQVHPRLGLSVGGAASEVPLCASGGAESSRRSFRLRTDPSHQSNYTPGTVSSAENVGGNYNVLPSQRSLRLQPDYNHLDFGPYSETENQSVLRPAVTSLRRNPQSRWYRASSSGAGSSNSAIFTERVSLPYEGPNSRSLPADISEHPMFTPATNTGISYQGPVNWSFSAGNIGTGGNIASSSRIGFNSGVNSPVPSLVPHRNPPQYPRRLSELVRRSLLSSAGAESGGQTSSYNQVQPGPSSHVIPLPPGSGNQGHHRLHPRSPVSLERHLGSALGIPYSARGLAASNEGRSRLVSEIRNVLDIMRRGEGLRFEDVMILDQSVLFGMADLHDRHRDMRLDVDNMSYEELLALEERIGNVCTGLNEETISRQLKQRKYVCIDKEEQAEAEPCCICQEEYTNGEDLGTLECGHDFHANCIKQWLMEKNLCPICKTTGLAK